MKSTTKNQLRTFLFSAGGVIVCAALLVGINMVVNQVSLRADLTEENLYTLSEGTRKLLDELDTPVDVHFFYSKSAASMPVYLKNYAARVEDLLREYRRASDGMITIRKYDPAPDSKAEDTARLHGIRGQMAAAAGETIYLGISVEQIDQTVALPYLDPGREAQLEYDLTRAIYRVSHPEKPTVGLISSLPVSGTQQMPMQRPTPGGDPWILVQELEKQFTVRELAAPEEIPAEVDVLLLIHPKDLSEKALFAIDQFVLGGGRLLAYLDPMSVVDSRQNPQGQFGQPQPSNLGPLLSAWGIVFDTERLVIDRVNKATVTGRSGQPEEYLPFLDLGPTAVSEDHPAVAELERVLMPFAGHFTGSAGHGLTRTVLLRTSEKSGTVPKFMAQIGGDQLENNVEDEGGQKALAIQLTGTFESAYPQGRPTGEDKEQYQDNEGDKAEGYEDKDEGGEASLKKSVEETTVVLVADADMLYDQFCVSRRQTILGPVSTPTSDNLSMALNLAELLGGDRNLIGIRSRGALNRPFEVIERKTAQAREEYQDTIAELEGELSRVESRLYQLQSGKSEDQKYILTPEQEEEIRRYERKRAKVNQKLKDVRRELRKEIDALKNSLKLVNIAAMPAVVAIGGIAFSLIRKRRMKNQ